MSIHHLLWRTVDDLGLGTDILARISRSKILTWLWEGETRALSELHLPAQTVVSIDSVSGTREYSIGLPEGVDLAAWAIHRVQFTDSNGDLHVVYPETMRGLDLAREAWVNDDVSTGNIPRWYYLKPSEGKIGFDIVPGVSVTGGIVIEFTRRARTPSLIYTTGTVTVENGDATVVGTGTAWTSREDIVAGVAFGVMPAVVAGVEPDPVPLRYYTVSSVTDATHLELTENYGEEKRSGASYVLCTKSFLSDRYSDYARLPILWAQAHIMKAEGRMDLYGGLMSEFEAELEKALLRIHTTPDQLAMATMGFAGMTHERETHHYRSRIGWAS